jgi:hypothetical protein
VSAPDLATPLGALLFGLFGAGHCLAMCGGIAVALALRAPRPHHALLHSIGRVLGYVAAGALVGALAAAGADGLAALADPGAVARALRLATAALFAALGFRLLLALPPWRALESLGAAVWRTALAPVAQRLGRSDGAAAALALGMLWGWLPCAMSWTALLAAATTGDAATGAWTMLAFGAGTLPALGVGAWLLGSAAAPLRDPRWRRASGALLLGLALWVAWGALATSHRHASDAPPAHHHGG